jgi:hypothetical protein
MPPSQPQLDQPPVDDVQPGLLSTFDHLNVQRELREQLDLLRAERDRLKERQRQVAELLKSGDPEKIVHDIRNLLHELNLYKALVERQAR